MIKKENKITEPMRILFLIIFSLFAHIGYMRNEDSEIETIDKTVKVINAV